ncbi:2Fe-2S iron-sulfur cluster-binding protein [Henriciella aquimarina]|uniref:2Fe-2S iron-sulfur cluster-binding protein n=1 Tax=Henriciella aquimarina TaxID=545261 RepID=UPI000A000988
MPKVIFLDHEGTERPVEAESGHSVMETAIRNDIPGIVAECGGACACATCHVYVDEKFLPRLDPPSDSELAMLEFAEGTTPASRLSCQIEVSEDLDGLKITTPETQY